MRLRWHLGEDSRRTRVDGRCRSVSPARAGGSGLRQELLRSVATLCGEGSTVSRILVFSSLRLTRRPRSSPTVLRTARIGTNADVHVQCVWPDTSPTLAITR